MVFLDSNHTGGTRRRTSTICRRTPRSGTSSRRSGTGTSCLSPPGPFTSSGLLSSTICPNGCADISQATIHRGIRALSPMTTFVERNMDRTWRHINSGTCFLSMASGRVQCLLSRALPTCPKTGNSAAHLSRLTLPSFSDTCTAPRGRCFCAYCF